MVKTGLTQHLRERLQKLSQSTFLDTLQRFYRISFHPQTGEVDVLHVYFTDDKWSLMGQMICLRSHNLVVSWVSLAPDAEV